MKPSTIASAGVIAALVGCGHDVNVAPDAPVGFCSDQMPLAPTFTNMQRLFTSVCVTCHTQGVELNLGAQVSYGSLVNQPPPNYADPATDESCGMILVSPGNPDGSYLFQKLSAAQPCAGSRMPLNDIGVTAPLAPCALALVHDWIAAGAPND